MAIKKGFHLTAKGLGELKKELADLKAHRLEVADKLKSAKELGDLSENSDWASAQDEYKFIEGRIAELEHVLQHAQVIKPPKNAKAVELGCSVVLKQSGKQMTYHLVGSLESDPEKGKISDESPIGKALMGKSVGDSVDIKTPAGKTTYKIVKIS